MRKSRQLPPRDVVFDPAIPRVFDESRNGPVRGAVYVIKVMPNGEREAYDRSYAFLGLLDDPAMIMLDAIGKITDRTVDWTGGRTNVCGRATWWTYRTHR